MVSWRTAAVLWLVAGLSSAFMVPLMTDQRLLAAFALGAVVGIVLAVASFLRRSERLARWGAAAGAVWLVVFVAVTLANLGDPIEYLVPVVWVAVVGAAAGWVSYRLAWRHPRSLEGRSMQGEISQVRAAGAEYPAPGSRPSGPIGGKWRTARRRWTWRPRGRERSAPRSERLHPDLRRPAWFGRRRSPPTIDGLALSEPNPVSRVGGTTTATRTPTSTC